MAGGSQYSVGDCTSPEQERTRSFTNLMFYCKSGDSTQIYLSRNTLQVGSVRHYACGHILQKIHFHLHLDCYPPMSTLCVLGRTLFIWKLDIIFEDTYVSDLRDKLQKVCWEQGIWVVFREAHPTIFIWSVGINTFKSKTD